MRLADLAIDGWNLVDAEMHARDHSGTFELPDLAVRRALQVGDYAKLIFNVRVEDDQPAIERMWVIVRDHASHGYVGMLDNVPTLIAPNDFLWRGAELTFEPRHVIDVQRPTPSSVAAAGLPPPLPLRGG